MDHAEHVAAVDREAAAFEAAIRAARPDDPIPSCAGWTVGELTDHVGGFLGFWTHVLCEGTGRPKPEVPPPSGPVGVGDWIHELRLHLVAELQATPPDCPVWTWVDADDHATFIARRCAHELAIHRFDAQAAGSGGQPIERDLALDGIDELADLAGDTQNDAFGSGETMHLHATDGEGEWLFALRPDGFVATHEHAKGDLALRGSASDLELALYGRAPLAPVERLGDEAVLDAWWTVWSFV